MTAYPFIWQEMSNTVTSTQAQTLLREALTVMRHAGIHHLPVVDNGELSGILSMRDVPDETAMLRVGDVMTRCVHTCGINERVGRAVDLMIEHRINSIPVVSDKGAVVGIITSTDLLKYLRRTLHQDSGEPFERLIAHLGETGDDWPEP